jgi:hypothetical protein
MIPSLGCSIKPKIISKPAHSWIVELSIAEMVELRFDLRWIGKTSLGQFAQELLTSIIAVPAERCTQGRIEFPIELPSLSPYLGSG